MSIHLLIAEADPTLRDDYRAYLSSVGFEVDSAASGLECLERLRTLRPDALIVDVDLPWGGGDGVLALLGDTAVDRPRAIIVLGSQPTVLLFDSDGQPTVSCLQKPVHPSSLVIHLATQLFAGAQEPQESQTS